MKTNSVIIRRLEELQAALKQGIWLAENIDEGRQVIQGSLGFRVKEFEMQGRKLSKVLLLGTLLSYEFAMVLDAQPVPPVVEWETLGTSPRSSAQAVTKASDGDYVVAGIGNNTPNCLLAKIAPTGVIRFTQTYSDGSTFQTGEDLIEVSTGGFLIVGKSLYHGLLENALFVRTTSKGELVWTKTLGDDRGFESLRTVLETPNGSFIAGGDRNEICPCTSTALDLYAVALSADGDLLWEHQVIREGRQFGGSLSRAHDDGYILAGSTQITGATPADVFLVKVAADGSEEWENTIELPGVHLTAAIEHTMAGYAIAGTTTEKEPNGDFFLMLVDTTGTRQWQRTYGGLAREEASDLSVVEGTGFTLVGFSESFGGSRRGYAVRTDMAGEKQWEMVLSEQQYIISAVYWTPKTGMVLAGTSYDPVVSSYFLYLAKYTPEVITVPQVFTLAVQVAPDQVGQLTIHLSPPDIAGLSDGQATADPDNTLTRHYNEGTLVYLNAPDRIGELWVFDKWVQDTFEYPSPIDFSTPMVKDKLAIAVYRKVLPTNSPPTILHDPVLTIPKGSAQVCISAEVIGTTTLVATVRLFYRQLGRSIYSERPLENKEENQWDACIDITDLDDIEYYLEAVDAQRLRDRYILKRYGHQNRTLSGGASRSFRAWTAESALVSPRRTRSLGASTSRTTFFGTREGPQRRIRYPCGKAGNDGQQRSRGAVGRDPGWLGADRWISASNLEARIPYAIDAKLSQLNTPFTTVLVVSALLRTG